MSDGISRPLEARLRSVAYGSMAYWYYEWDWGEAVAYDGLDAVAPLLPEAAFGEFVVAGIRRWTDFHAKTGEASRMGPVACAARRLGTEDSWESLRPALESYIEAISGTARATNGSVLLDHPSPVVFVDSLYGDPPALALLAEPLGRPELYEQAVEVCLGHLRSLQDERLGLFRHYCDSASGESPDILWGRGNGWAFLGLADLLEVLGDRPVEGVAEVRQRFQLACEGLLLTEVPGGGWRNLMAHDASTPESSTTALISAALFVAVNAGELDGERFSPLAQRGWRAIEHRVDANGHLMDVSFRPGLNKDPARYEHVPLVGSYPWGQGPYLRAARAWHDHEKRQTSGQAVEE